MRCITSAVLVVASVASTAGDVAAQVRVGDLVGKDVLVRTVPAGPQRPEALELQRARVGRLTTMRARTRSDGSPGAVYEQREVFLAMHGRSGSGFEDYLLERGTVALKEDDGYRVLLVEEDDVERVQRLETLTPPGEGYRPELLHIRLGQTGSGGITRDVLFALDETSSLVEVPIVAVDFAPLLQDGEYLCCGRFTDFDQDLVELSVYVTRNGRPDVTHRIRARYRLEGRFRRDPETDRYVPDFRLVPGAPTAREPIGAP